MAKEEGKGSYSMNNNVTDDYSTHIGEDDEDQITKSQAWGTWEELLLACAVKKHGFSDWDSVATEVRSRSSVSAVFVSANNCKLKYRDLKLRFQESAGMSDTAAAAEVEGGDEERDGDIPWLEELRSLRVAELRREVERYDVSILSLQLKVKKLEEEIEGSVVGEEKPDLEDERKGERLGNDGFEFKQRETAISTAEDSDRENRSMNESNSTASGEKNARVGGDEPSQTRDDSGDNNLDSDPKVEEGSVSRGSEASHSGELGESGTSERKWRRKRRKLSDGSEDNHAEEDGEIKTAASKSQPLIDLLDLIRSHPRGSLFERRLRSQETQDYKSMVKQHLDIETIHKKLKQGSYDSSNVSFYRDLQLLFTNAIVFFPSSSSESMAAHELKTVVSEEMRKETGTKSGNETSEPSLSRQKSSAPPLVVCKKRKLVNGKASCSPSSSSFSQKEETKEETLSEEIVTGLRSSRRANKLVPSSAAVITNNSKAGRGKNKKQTNSSNENDRKQTEKKRGSSSDKKKSMTEFLERLKKNSPQKDQNKSGGSGKKGSNKKPSEVKRQSVSKKKVEVENSSPVKRGRGKKKTEETEATPTPKRGKESKQPKKRTRR